MKFAYAAPPPQERQVPMTDDRRVVFEDTTARWATAQGYITAMSLQHNDRNYTAVFLTRNELQAIVSAAAGQYGIRPEGPAQASTADLDQIRTDHQLTTTTARHGEFIDNIAGCTCGVTFGWYGRGTEHEHHVDEQIVARFTGR